LDNQPPAATIVKPNRARIRVLAGHTVEFAAEVHDAEEPNLTAAAGSWSLTLSGSDQPVYRVSGQGGSSLLRQDQQAQSQRPDWQAQAQ
jgi:hypothetical protein